MQEFTGKEYVMIDIANQAGHDKLRWDERIQWTKDNVNHLEAFTDKAKEPVLFYKAVKAYRAAERGKATGFIMGLDASSSGIQIKAVASCSQKDARHSNVINTGERENVYQMVATEMNKRLDSAFTADELKYPVMTTFYGSKRQPMLLFGEDTPELQAFYDILFQELPGAMELMGTMQGCWDPTTLAHSWTMPDGHVVVAKVMIPVDKKIEVDELQHATFTHRANINAPDKKGLSLAANIIHSIDGWIVREMIRRCDKDGFEMATIHDSFWCHPNHMNLVRLHYVEILAEIADSTLMQNILREITGTNERYIKKGPSIAPLVRQAEYALS